MTTIWLKAETIQVSTPEDHKETKQHQHSSNEYTTQLPLHGRSKFHASSQNYLEFSVLYGLQLGFNSSNTKQV